MKISEVRVTLRDEERLKAFANITLDDCFVVRGVKVIQGPKGYFVSMPSRKREDGTHSDIAHPTNAEMRQRLEEAVLVAYTSELKVKLQASSDRRSGLVQANSEEPVSWPGQQSHNGRR